MINAITDLAKAILEKRLNEIETCLKEITHPGTIGDMYEGLTIDVVKNVFSNVPDIHVSNGFIKNYRTGLISPQTDVIIYFGEAEEIPETEHKIVSIDNVIAFIEVKKTFKLKEFEDFYEKQGKIYDLVDSEVKYDQELFEYSKKSIFGCNELNGEKIKTRSKLEYYLYHILKTENAEPLRICIGYDGFKTEKTLRDNLIKVIENRATAKKNHTGMNSLPTLVISGDNCLIKMIGCPYSCVYSDPYGIMSSYKGNTWKIFLKMLLCKIECKIGSCFELELDDFSVFKLNDFLLASINEKEDDATQYYIYKKENGTLKKNKYIEIEWEPTVLTTFEYNVAERLCNLSFSQNPAISINDEWFLGKDLQKELSNLIKNRFVSIHDGYVELISISALVGIARGEFLIGENNSNQMIQWLMKHGKE